VAGDPANDQSAYGRKCKIVPLKYGLSRLRVLGMSAAGVSGLALAQAKYSRAFMDARKYSQVPSGRPCGRQSGMNIDRLVLRDMDVMNNHG
jgi:hypothetical protein